MTYKEFRKKFGMAEPEDKPKTEAGAPEPEDKPEPEAPEGESPEDKPKTEAKPKKGK